jgi:uncharacterized RDD family membrane protein YckC
MKEVGTLNRQAGEDESHPVLSAARHRCIAGLFDLSILILGSVLIMLPSLFVFIGAVRNPSDSRTVAVFLAMFLTGALVGVFDLAYRVGVPYYYGGQTLGYRFFKMRILAENGSAVSLKSLVIRSLSIFFLVIFTLGLYYVVEAIALACSDTHRGFADTLSQTIVVDIPDDAK